ncbi:MAG TPA: hypothetical protein VK915_11855 [Gaiellaceae bacterium]|nr:hypothetical protein [Gaiellaceae bacterium]
MDGGLERCHRRLRRLEPISGARLATSHGRFEEYLAKQQRSRDRLRAQTR